MKDQLEDFVRRNRPAFDDKEPSPAIWKGIERSLGLSMASWNRPLFLWRAAAIFFMAMSALLLATRQTATVENAQALKEFSDVEAFYNQQISSKVELIDELSNSEGLNGVTHHFQQLEAMYLVLKEEMKSRPSQKVKDALVLNLLVRIELLNQQLHVLEKDDVEAGENTGEDKRSSQVTQVSNIEKILQVTAAGSGKKSQYSEFEVSSKVSTDESLTLPSSHFSILAGNFLISP